MSDQIWITLERWKWAIGTLVLLGISIGALKAEINDKAPKDAVEQIQQDLTEIKDHDLKEIKDKLDDLDTRQRQFFCLSQPAWCR